MKEIIILIVVLMLILIPNIFFKLYLRSSGQEIIDTVNEMKNHLKQDEEIDQLDAKKLKANFRDKEKKWILIVDHDMLDEIEYEIEDCVAYYSKETIKEFFSAANRLSDEIEDLAKREEISLANIL